MENREEFVNTKMDALRILLIDDDNDDYLLTKDIVEEIRNKNLKLDWVASYEEGLKKLDEDIYDVYLVDYRLGENDGISLLKYAKQISITKPLIFLTGMNKAEIDSLAMQEGASDFLIKGKFDADLLERSIRYSIHQKKTENQLAYLNTNKDKLFNIIAHDLRGPFNSLMGYLNISVEDFSNLSNDELYSYIVSVKDISSGVLELLNNLLIWAQNQWKGISFNPQPLNLSEIVNEALKPLILRANSKNISIVNNIADNSFLNGDRNLLETIIRNLISNSIKFTNRNGQIIVESSYSKDFITISVKDTGVGMTNDIIDKLFMVSKNKSNKGTEGEAGTGLGLLICKDFVEKHGGKIWVSSEPGVGSTFSFSVPS